MVIDVITEWIFFDFSVTEKKIFFSNGKKKKFSVMEKFFFSVTEKITNFLHCVQKVFSLFAIEFLPIIIVHL